MNRFPTILVLACLAAVVTAANEVQGDNSNAAFVVDGNQNGNPQDNNDDDDDDLYSHYYKPHEGNSTLSATFSIQVTPEHYHLLSWLILWLSFVASVAFGMHQIRLERKWLRHVLAASSANKGSRMRSQSSSRLRKYSVVHGGAGSPVDPEQGQGGGRPLRFVRSGSRPNASRMSLSSSTASLTSSSNPGNLGDEQAVSNGDFSRATFRRLLLVGLASRAMAIPIQIYSDPLWVQLIADTFPVMTYATAWTWLVSFFIQLVAVAMGTTNNVANTASASAGAHGSGTRSPSDAHRSAVSIDTVLQITAYSVYVLLIIAFSVFRRIAAAVLLYALLCCVYATLLGTGLYFCPQLLRLLLPALDGKWKSPLAVRLVACSSASLLVFAARTFNFARKVVQSTAPVGHKSSGPYWWFQYGALELLPGIVFLILLHPKQVTPPQSPATNSNNNPKSGRGVGYASDEHPPPSGRRTPPLAANLKRSDSIDSKSGHRTTPSPQTSQSPPPPTMILQQQQRETAPLLASAGNRYGAATMGGGDEAQYLHPQHGGE